MGKVERMGRGEAGGGRRGPALWSGPRRAGGLAIALALPLPAAAHGVERGLVLLMPTGLAMAGGAAAVAATFLLLAAGPEGALRRIGRAEWRLGRWPRWPEAPASLASAAGLALLLLAGAFGAPDPLRNPLPLAVWVLFWVGFTQLQALTGSLWPWANPWSGPLALLGRSARGAGPWRLPAALGLAPAIPLFLAFAWLELVSLAPQDPAGLALLVASYWALTLAALLAFGRDWWRRGEPFAIWFGLVGRLSPLRRRGGRVALVWPGRQLAEAPALGPSGVAFVILLLGAAAFDGLSETFAWLALIGINPLDFPGRSAVMAANTAGLVATPLAMGAVFAGAVWFGARLAGRRGQGARLTGRLAHALVPVAVAFQGAHHLPFLLMQGQYLWAAASDPLGRGRDLFGTAGHHVTGAFLTDFALMQRIWAAQVAAIVLGHGIGILVGHLIALEEFGSARRAALSQLPLAAAMVGYTAFGLWLLSTPVAG